MYDDNLIYLIDPKDIECWLEMNKVEKKIIGFISEWSLRKGYRDRSGILKFLVYKFRSDSKFIFSNYKKIILTEWPISLCEEYEENNIIFNTGVKDEKKKTKDIRKNDL